MNRTSILTVKLSHYYVRWEKHRKTLQKRCIKIINNVYVCIMYVYVLYVCKTPHFLRDYIFSTIFFPSPSVSITGLEGMECSLPVDGRQVSLSVLSEDSFRECRGLLTLTDYLIVIFSGICISVAAIIASFFLASTIHCFQRLKSKRTDEEEAEDWGDLLDRMEVINYP